MAAIIGFTPNWYFGQQNAGLGIWISTGTINGTEFNGQFVSLPANAITSIGITAQGQIVLGAGPDLYPIAVVVTGQVVTSGNTKSSTPFGGATKLNQNQQIYYATNNGVLGITDARPLGAFSFGA